MTTRPVVSSETYREKALRKFKQQPLVPVGAPSLTVHVEAYSLTSLQTGAAATTVALVIAMTKMRKGQSRSLNNWLRVRIIAQGFTVAAVVVGSWAYGTSKPTPELDTTAALEKAAQERVAFEERLRLAEEVTRAESGLASSAKGQAAAAPTTERPSSSPMSGSRPPWWRWYGSTGGSDKPT